MLTFPMEMGLPGAAGALCHRDGVAAGGNSTMVYFNCDDCATEASRVAKAGGQLMVEKMSIGSHGFIAIAADTEGNMIGLHSAGGRQGVESPAIPQAGRTIRNGEESGWKLRRVPGDEEDARGCRPDANGGRLDPPPLGRVEEFGITCLETLDQPTAGQIGHERQCNGVINRHRTCPFATRRRPEDTNGPGHVTGATWHPTRENYNVQFPVPGWRFPGLPAVAREREGGFWFAVRSSAARSSEFRLPRSGFQVRGS
jgi:hypothetical protein